MNARPLAAPLVLVALTAATGCLGSNHRVRVRRDPPGPTVEDRKAEATEAYDEAIRLNAAKREQNAYLKLSERETARIAKGPRDPWASYEEDRRRVLLQPWADTGKPSPPAVEEKPKPSEDEAAPAPKKPEKKDAEGEKKDGDAPKDEAEKKEPKKDE